MAIIGSPLWSDRDMLHFDSSNGREVTLIDSEWFYVDELAAKNPILTSVESWIEQVLKVKRNEEPMDSYHWAGIQGYIQALVDIQSVIEANRD